MNKIRKGDQVIVLTGRDKGRRGTVLSRVDEERLIVEGGRCVGVAGHVVDQLTRRPTEAVTVRARAARATVTDQRHPW